MRTMTLAIWFGCLGGFVVAQTPAVRIGSPVPVNTPTPLSVPPAPSPLPPPIPGEAPPAPPAGFNVGSPPTGPVSQPVGPQPYFPPPTIVQQSPPNPPTPRVWGTFEYLLWYSEGDQIPPLVSNLGSNGRLDTLSNDTSNSAFQSGFRATLGAWFDLTRSFGVEGNYLWFVRGRDYNGYNDGPTQVLVRPFIDAVTNQPTYQQLSNSTGTLRGFARVYSVFDADGWEVNGLFRAPAMFSEEVHLLLGVRSFGLKEQLGIEGIAYNPATGVAVSSFDEFRTRNRFYGAQVGARWNYYGERWTLDITGKFAIGGVGQEGVLQGVSVRATQTDRTTATGGLLVQGTNLGDHDRTRFAFMPELAINVGYRITSFATMFVGYDFLYINNVVRPGGQVDSVVNSTFIPYGAGGSNPSQRPAYPNKGDSFWLQGINFGVAFRF